MIRGRKALLGATLTFVVITAACTTKSGSQTEVSTDSKGVKTDVGVTDDTITLGVQADLSGVFKASGLGLTHGDQIWADTVNAEGGICGREIKINVVDHGYDAAKAKTLFSDQQAKILGYVTIVGSPPAAALKPLMVENDMLGIPSGVASTGLDVPNFIMAASTYDIETINGLAYLQKIGKLPDGNKIGHIYLDSEYGQNALLGSKYYAKEHDQKIVESKITSADTDLSSSVVKMKQEKVDAIVISGTPAQTGSLVTLADSMGVPILGSAPTFDVGLVDTPAKDSFGNFYHMAFNMPFSSDAPTNQAIVQAYNAKYTDPPIDYVQAGYISGLAWEGILTKACSLKDLTRSGVLKAAAQAKADAKGLAGQLDFTNPGEPATRESLVEKVDPAAPGGLTVIEPLSASKEATSYKTPFQK